MEEPIQFADILTPTELQTNIRFVTQMILNRELVLGYVELGSNKVRTVEEIRVRLTTHQVEVKSNLDREWKPVKLNDIVVQ